MVQCIGLCTSTSGGTGSIPGQGTKIPHAVQCSKKKKKKKSIGFNVGCICIRISALSCTGCFTSNKALDGENILNLLHRIVWVLIGQCLYTEHQA